MSDGRFVHYGAELGVRKNVLGNKHILRMLEREAFFLKVLIAPKLSRTIVLDSLRYYLTTPIVRVLGGAPIAVYLVMVIVHLMRGRRDADALFELLETTQLPMLNGLATLMLSFYASLVMEQYRSIYQVCQSVKHRLVELVLLSSAMFGSEVDGGEKGSWQKLNPSWTPPTCVWPCVAHQWLGSWRGCIAAQCSLTFGGASTSYTPPHTLSRTRGSSCTTFTTSCFLFLTPSASTTVSREESGRGCFAGTSWRSSSNS